MCDRVAFQRALTSGMTAHEYRQSPQRAREEMAAVYELVFGEPYAQRRRHPEQYVSLGSYPRPERLHDDENETGRRDLDAAADRG